MSVLCLFAAILPPLVSVQEATPSDSDNTDDRAEIIGRLVEYIDWPGNRKEDSNKTVIIAVLGDRPLTEALNRYAERLPAQSRSVTAIDIVSYERAAECHLAVFDDPVLDSLQLDTLKSVLPVLLREGVVTVGRSAAFLARGGMIAVIWDGHKYRVTASWDTVSASGVKIDPGLLHMAIATKDED